MVWCWNDKLPKSEIRVLQAVLKVIKRRRLSCLADRTYIPEFSLSFFDTSVPYNCHDDKMDLIGWKVHTILPKTNSYFPPNSVYFQQKIKKILFLKFARNEINFDNEKLTQSSSQLLQGTGDTTDCTKMSEEANSWSFSALII